MTAPTHHREQIEVSPDLERQLRDLEPVCEIRMTVRVGAPPIECPRPVAFIVRMTCDAGHDQRGGCCREHHDLLHEQAARGYVWPYWCRGCRRFVEAARFDCGRL